MAIMGNSDRVLVSAEWQRTNTASVSIIKSDLQAAINAIDQWVSDNTTAYNTAIPNPARSNLSTSQKAQLLLFVVNRRFITNTG